jgi:plasmid stabilization system protein ParE
MSHFILSPEADQDLDDIWEYIAHDDIDAADRWDSKLRESFALLAQNPHIGHTRQDLTPYGVLFWPVGKYLILYRSLREGIDIVAVTQGTRNISSWLRKRS